MKIPVLPSALILGFAIFSHSENARAINAEEEAPASSAAIPAPGFPTLPDQPEGWNALPRSRPFGLLPSDPRDLRLGLFKNNKGELEADVAGYRSLVGWRGTLFEGPFVFHGGIEGAAYFQMTQQGSRFPLQSSDGLVGVYGEAAQGPWAWQARYTHISAHLSDGLFGIRAPVLYTREFLSLRAARQFDWFRVYAGPQILTHTAPALPRFSLKAGAYAILPPHWGATHPYLGADLHARNAQEGSTFQLGAGAAVVSRTGGAPLLLTATYLKGHDLRGQFYQARTEKWTIGVDLGI